MKIAKTTPDVFIVESLTFEDEEHSHAEGEFLSHILRLAGRRYKYFYIRTRAELEEVLNQFHDSQFRYLHISCHANRGGVALTLDHLTVADLGEVLTPYLEHRRVFFSACELATRRLATALLRDSGCYSVIAPSQRVDFDAAALFWASMYHLMFKNDRRAMKRDDLARNLEALSALFRIQVRFFSKSASAPTGFREISIGT